MENDVKIAKQIKAVYTEIARRLVDREFSFPEGGKANRSLLQFITEFAEQCGGIISSERIVDYCVFQLHKNRLSPYQRKLALSAFGHVAQQKYLSMSSPQKRYMEDQWLSGANITRQQLIKLICVNREHPLAKYIYMPSEEPTKRRCHNTEIGYMFCQRSTLGYSPFSEACGNCNFVDACKKATAEKFPELYRIRLERYDKGE